MPETFENRSRHLWKKHVKYIYKMHQHRFELVSLDHLGSSQIVSCLSKKVKHRPSALNI